MSAHNWLLETGFISCSPPTAPLPHPTATPCSTPFSASPARPQASRKVLAFTDLPSPRERLAGMAAALDACQRALSDFLEEKRGAFPRWGLVALDP